MITKFLALVDGKEVLVSYLPLSHVAAQVGICTIAYDSFLTIFNILQITDIYSAITLGAQVYFGEKDALKVCL